MSSSWESRRLDVRAPAPAGAQPAGVGERGTGWSGPSGFRVVTRPAPFGLVEPVVVSVGRVGEVHVVVVRRYPCVAIQLEVEPGEGRARTNGRWTTRRPPSFPRRVPFTTRTENSLDEGILRWGRDCRDELHLFSAAGAQGGVVEPDLPDEPGPVPSPHLDELALISIDDEHVAGRFGLTALVLADPPKPPSDRRRHGSVAADGLAEASRGSPPRCP